MYIELLQLFYISTYRLKYQVISLATLCNRHEQQRIKKQRNGRLLHSPTDRLRAKVSHDGYDSSGFQHETRTFSKYVFTKQIIEYITYISSLVFY